MDLTAIVTEELVTCTDWQELRKRYTALSRWHYDQFQTWAIKDGWTVAELLRYWDALPIAEAMRAKEGRRNHRYDD